MGLEMAFHFGAVGTEIALVGAARQMAATTTSILGS